MGAADHQRRGDRRHRAVRTARRLGRGQPAAAGRSGTAAMGAHRAKSMSLFGRRRRRGRLRPHQRRRPRPRHHRVRRRPEPARRHQGAVLRHGHQGGRAAAPRTSTDVRVPAENMLGEVGKGFTQVMQGFDFSRALIGLQCMGTPSRPSTKPGSTSPSGRPSTGRSARTRASSFPLAESETLLTAARLLCYQTLWLKDPGLPHTSEAAMCKWWAPKTAYDVIKLPAAARPVRVPHRKADRATTAGRPGPADR